MPFPNIDAKTKKPDYILFDSSYLTSCVPYVPEPENTNLLQINHFFQIFLGDITFLAKHTIQLLVNLFLCRGGDLTFNTPNFYPTLVLSKLSIVQSSFLEGVFLPELQDAP